MDSPFFLNVVDLKQYIYCPRKVYFSYVMPVEKRPTFKMEYGKIAEEKIDRLETRRKLKRYRLSQGKRYFHQWIKSDKLGLSGQIDLLIGTEDKFYPVDFKFVRGTPYKSHIYQLTGYALILEDVYHREISCGFIYLILEEKVFTINLNQGLKEDCLNLLKEIRTMVLNETIPQPSKFRKRCIECECQNFCRDVW